jgi:ectoine hydroxylase-related dioxygenase (phytanoyl-CoA dioxygenase family)
MVGVSTIWALDDFTEDNGATQVIPDSHLWSEDEQPQCDKAVTITMLAGSVLVFAGNLFHRGGANRSQAARRALTVQYCMPWLRQIENMSPAVPPSAAR